MTKGGKQGGTETPFLWLLYMEFIVRPLEQKWKTENRGVQWLEVYIAMMKWVDDLWLLGSSMCEVLLRWVELTDRLKQFKLNRSAAHFMKWPDS